MSVVNLLCGVYFRKSCCLYVQLSYVFHSLLEFTHLSSLLDPTASTIAIAIAIATTMVIVVMLIVIKEPCSEPQGTWLDYLRDLTTVSSWRQDMSLIHFIQNISNVNTSSPLLIYYQNSSWLFHSASLKTLALCIWLTHSNCLSHQLIWFIRYNSSLIFFNSIPL